MLIQYISYRTIMYIVLYTPQSTHRVAMAIFWRSFHHDNKISPAWWGLGCTPSPFIYLPSWAKLWCMLQLRGQIHSTYFSSTPTSTLWYTLPVRVKHKITTWEQEANKKTVLFLAVVGIGSPSTPQLAEMVKSNSTQIEGGWKGCGFADIQHRDRGLSRFQRQ